MEWEPLRIGDRVWVHSADIPTRFKYIGYSGTISAGDGFSRFGLVRVNMDCDGRTINMCSHRFRKSPIELKYDPMQQGDTDEDI